MIEFARIVQLHLARYPLMRPQDFCKLAYQSEFGPEHMIAAEQAVSGRLLAEWQSGHLPVVAVNPEPIGNGLCRFYLTDAYDPAKATPVLARLFIQSAHEHRGTPEGLAERLELFRKLPVEGMEAWLAQYKRQGYPPMHHSDTYREAYHPHYRVLREPLAQELPGLLST